MTATATPAAIEVRDLVVSTGPRGHERVLLAGMDLTVGLGEVLALEAEDPDARSALVDVLAGRRRPVYGLVRPSDAEIEVLHPKSPVTPGGPCVVDTGAAAPTRQWCVSARAERNAVLLVGPAATLSGLPANRTLRLQGGYARPVAPAEIRVPTDLLSQRVRWALARAGTPNPVAERVADVLVDAEVRGHASHGVQLLPMYLDRVARGGINATAMPEWIGQAGAVRVLAANGGFGQVAAALAAEECATLAKQHGIAAVGVRGNNHVGMLAAYREPFLRTGVVALILNISGPSVAAPGAGKAGMGNNAVCMISPAGPDGAPLISDFATGTVASGKIRDAATCGRQLPAGWLVDAAGSPSADPHDLDRGGAVPVFGGHKGLGVSVIVEVLAGMLAGGTVSPLVHKQRQEPDRPMDCAQLFIGFDPDAFGATAIGALSGTLRDTVAASYGTTLPEVYFPEQQERLRAAEAARAGISVPAALASQLGLAGTDEPAAAVTA